MNDYLFLMGHGHLNARAARIAENYGARLVNYTEPDGRKRHWFAGPNLGLPHDEIMAKAVRAALQAEAYRRLARRVEGSGEIT